MDEVIWESNPRKGKWQVLLTNCKWTQFTLHHCPSPSCLPPHSHCDLLCCTLDTCLSKAYITTLTPELIKTAFHKTRIWPFNPNVITADMLAPSKETSVQSHLPVPTSSQTVQILATMLQDLQIMKDTPESDAVLISPLVFPPESHCSAGTVQDSGCSPGRIWWDCFPTPVLFDSSGNPVGIPTLFRHHVDYSWLPHIPYPLVDCPGYGVSGSMDFEERPNKGQTNKILFKNQKKKSENRYTMLLLLKLPKCTTMRP